MSTQSVAANINQPIDNLPTPENISRVATSFFPNRESCLEIKLLDESTIDEMRKGNKSLKELDSLLLSPAYPYPNTLLQQIKVLSHQLGKNIPDYPRKKPINKASWIVYPEQQYLVTKEPKTPQELKWFWKNIITFDTKTILAALLPNQSKSDHSLDYCLPRHYPLKIDDEWTIFLEEEISVAKSKTIEECEIIQRTFLACSAHETKTLHHYHYQGWKDDQGVPDPELLAGLFIEWDKKSSPVAIHCSSGHGRSGTVVLADIIRRRILAQAPKASEEIQINVGECLLQGRLLRDGFLATPDQLTTAWETAVKAALHPETSLNFQIGQIREPTLDLPAPEEISRVTRRYFPQPKSCLKTTLFDEQMIAILGRDTLKWIKEQKIALDVLKQNLDTDFAHFLLEKILGIANKIGPRKICAYSSNIPGNKASWVVYPERKYLMTAEPEPHELKWFWKNAITFDTKAIVAALQPNEKGSDHILDYCLPSHYPLEIDDTWTITLNQETVFAKSEKADGCEIIKRTFLAQSASETKTLHHYHYQGWKDGKGAPDSDLLAKLLLELDHKSPITVHCHAGRGRSGTVVLADAIRQRVQTQFSKGSSEIKLNIAELLLQGKLFRYGFVHTSEQLRNAFDAAIKSLLLSSFDKKTYPALDDLLSSYKLAFQAKKNLPEKSNRIPTEGLLSEEEEDYERLEDATGERSVASLGFIEGLSNFSGLGLTVGSKKYVPINGFIQGFSKRKMASCGSSSTREIILLDPANSPTLKSHYTEFRKTVHPGMTTQEVLKLLKRYVRGQIFPSYRSNSDYHNLIINARQTHPFASHKNYPTLKIPLMSIEDFIKSGTGACRHHGLVAAYMIDRLLSEENPLIQGTVQHIRGNLDSGGGHVWVVFIPKRQKGSPKEMWHLDTLWNVLVNFAEEKEKKMLELNYGKRMVQDQINRTSSFAKLNDQG